jgi:hypothetical protein
MTYNFDHYFAIKARRDNHLKRGFTHQAKMDEKELAGEIEFLNENGVDTSPLTMSDEELLAELGAL